MTALEFVGAAFEHRETGKIPLWGIIKNRQVYEHILGPGRVGNTREVSLEDKLRLHSEAFEALGIDITRAQLWPPDPGSAAGGESGWRKPEFTAGAVENFVPSFPSDEERDAAADIGRRQVLVNSPHTVFAPTIRGVFCPTFERMGLEQFSYALADAPEHVERLMVLETEYAQSMAERFARTVEVRYAAIVDDFAYKGSTIARPEWMRSNWIPKLAEVTKPLKEGGKRVIFHSDGNIGPLIPDLISIGVDAINPLEPLAGMDLAHIKREYGNDVTLIGGVDCSQLLPFGTPQEIRDEVRRLLDIGAPGGGFIIGDSSNVLPVTPVENLLAFYDTVHEYAF